MDGWINFMGGVVPSSLGDGRPRHLILIQLDVTKTTVVNAQLVSCRLMS